PAPPAETAPPVQAPPAKAAEKPAYPVPESTPVTDEFGANESWRTRQHTGLDLGAPMGAEIHAALSGKVVEAKYSAGYGNYVTIDHGNGLFTRYAHQPNLKVTKGQDVKQGDVIGVVGSTGVSTGPHLHFEVLEGGLDATVYGRDSRLWLQDGTLTGKPNPNAAH
ncbi:MAG: Peptidase, partial [Thermoleophilia bacterium]|nr:Peptidase [Thermoleophilia bacterium]